MLRTLLDMIYPVRCPLCGDIVTINGEQICPTCEERLPYIKEPRCMKCSKPIEDEEKEFCSDCERKSYQFDKGYAVWVYDKQMKQSLADFKYHSRKEYADFYVNSIIDNYGDKIKKLAPDFIIPVPIHRSKYLERGYNQADILAKKIGKRLDIPVLSNYLIRNKKTVPQKQLNDKERLRNLTEAFQINEKLVNATKRPETVLLVDDIYTTGSTIEACTKLLKSNGVTKVYFVVICIGKGF